MTASRLMKVFAVVIIGAILAVGLLFGMAHRNRIRAHALLLDFQALRLGQSTFDDAQRLARKYGGEPWGVPAQPVSCSPQDCVLRFIIKNRLPAYVPTGIVQQVQFTAGLFVRDGKIVTRDFIYETDTKSDSHFLYMVHDSSDSSPTNHRHYGDESLMRLKTDPQGIPHWIEIRLSPSSSADERERAYAVDLSCLAALHGCDGPANVFPRGLHTN